MDFCRCDWYQVKVWRRSFDTPPPPMEKDHPYYDQIVKDRRYADGPSGNEFPMFESLKLTIERTLPYWNDVIVPQIKQRKRIIIAAHGNSLRGIIKYLDGKYSYIDITVEKAFTFGWRQRSKTMSSSPHRLYHRITYIYDDVVDYNFIYYISPIFQLMLMANPKSLHNSLKLLVCKYK